MALVAGGCSTTPCADPARPALALPAAIAARYALPGPVAELYLAPLGGAAGCRYFRGRIGSGTEAAEFELVLPAGEEPAPVVLCLPILAGGEDLIWVVGTELASRGYAAMWTRRVAAALRPPQRSHDLEQLFRRTVIQNRMLLQWADAQPAWFRPGPRFALGISFGGMVATALLAVEPRLDKVAIVLAGGDLPHLVFASAEPRAIAWRRWRALADGIGRSELTRELAREAVSDPVLLGPYVPAEKVFFVSAAFDTVVPPAHQDLLWESLGRPRRLTVPLGHYSAAVLLGPIVGAIAGFFGPPNLP